MPDNLDSGSNSIHFEELPLETNNWGMSNGTYRYSCQLINEAMKHFNQATTAHAKLNALKEMQTAIETVDIGVSPDILVKAQGFHDMKAVLLPKIKAAYAENGVNSMLKPGRADSPLARIVSDMSPDKADRLMEILNRNIKTPSSLDDAFNNLYTPDDTSEEAGAWKNFRNNFTVTILEVEGENKGGNCRNFKVTNNLDGSVQIHKVDNRLGNSRHVEMHLRQRLGNVFTPIHADRQVLGMVDGKKISCTLIVTDFCARGSLDGDSKKVRAKNNMNKTYSYTSDMMGQMASILTDIQGAECCFPDAKLTNWLVDANGKIRIADTKSFLFTTPDGEYWPHGMPGHDKIARNTGVDLITTEGFQPTEMFRGKFKADGIHASILGRNIYACLTGEWPSSMTFSKPVFFGPLGSEYKQLIQQLTVDPAANRMRLEDAQDKLTELGMKAKAKLKESEMDAHAELIVRKMKVDPEYQILFDKANELDISNIEIQKFVKSKIVEGVSDKAIIAEEFHKKLQLKSIKHELQVAMAFKEFKNKFQKVQEQIKGGPDQQNDHGRPSLK